MKVATTVDAILQKNEARGCAPSTSGEGKGTGKEGATTSTTWQSQSLWSRSGSRGLRYEPGKASSRSLSPRSDLQRLRSCPAINGTRARQPWPEPHGYPGSTGLRVWALLIRVRGFFAVVDESSPPALTSWLNSGRFLFFFFFCPPCGEGKPRERKRTQGGWGRGRE